MCFDASADIEQENWLSLVDGYAQQQGVTGWPTGAGWPKKAMKAQLAAAQLDAADTASAEHAASALEKADKQQLSAKGITSNTSNTTLQEGSDLQNKSEIGYCNVWVGNAAPQINDDNPSRSRRLGPGEEWRLSESGSGMTVVYLPFLPNPKVRGVDPNTSTFMSTWNFVYNPAEIDKVVALAKANFQEGEAAMKKVVRSVYQRKKAKRLYLESREERESWRLQLQDHGDHFS